jgi:histone acetyltransferase (RNA polymerase elongator complex component)
VAFYGGTFTRLPISKMTELLKAVNPYIEQGHFQTIRVSTRPDAVDEERLCLIKDLGVSTVELGVQSLDDDVLKASKRGYTAEDVLKSVQMLHKHAFRVGIQLMPGLPEDSYERFMNTVHGVLSIKPHMVRLYPAIVIKGTELEKLYYANKYQPLSLEEAVAICQDSCLHLEGNGIPVIRMGLMASPSLTADGQIVAGPWHEAFGFLVRSSIHQKSIEPYLPLYGTVQQVGLRVPNREIPLVRGYKNQGLDIIEKKTGVKVLYVKGDASVPSGQVEIDRFEGPFKIKNQPS